MNAAALAARRLELGAHAHTVGDIARTFAQERGDSAETELS